MSYSFDKITITHYSILLLILIVLSNTRTYSQSLILPVEGYVVCDNKKKKAEIYFYEGNPEKEGSKLLKSFPTNRKGHLDKTIKIETNIVLYTKIFVDDVLEAVLDTFINSNKTYNFGIINVCQSEESFNRISDNINIKTYDSEEISLRKEPNSKSKVYLNLKLKSGNSYELIDSSDYRNRILWDEPPNKLVIAYDYWYKIKYNDEIEGWINGCYTNKALAIEKRQLAIKTGRITKVYNSSNYKSEMRGTIPQDKECKVLNMHTEIENNKSIKWYKVSFSENDFSITGWVKFRNSMTKI